MLDKPNVIPLANLLKPKNETVYTICENEGAYQIFALMIQSEQRQHIYSCVKEQESQDK